MVVWSLCTENEFNNFKMNTGYYVLLFHNRNLLHSQMMKTWITELAMSFTKTTFVFTEQQFIFNFYGVTDSPTVILFYQQKETHRFVGNKPVEVERAISNNTNSRISRIMNMFPVVLILDCDPNRPDENSRRMRERLDQLNVDYGIYDTREDNEVYDRLYKRNDPPYPQCIFHGKSLGTLTDLEKNLQMPEFIAALPKKQQVAEVASTTAGHFQHLL